MINSEENANKALAPLAKSGLCGGGGAVQCRLQQYFEKGGDLGWVMQSKLAEPIVNAIFKLNPGGYSKFAIKIYNVFYIMKVEDVRK